MKNSRGLPSLNALRAFEAAARHASVSLAAMELHVTHGAVSRQIRALEHELGVDLFRRQGRGLALTTAGRELQASAHAAFEDLRAACARLRPARSDAPLVLGCPGSLLARWVIPRLERLGRELPELRLHLSALDQAPAPANDLDAWLIAAESPLPAHWQGVALAQETVGPVLSPHYADAARLQGLPASALLHEPLLHTGSRPQAWPTWARLQGLPPEALRLGQGFDHLYYLLEAAVAGLGVAIAPQQLVSDEIATGRLLAPWGFVPSGAQWWLCADARRWDARLTPLGHWLTAALAGNDVSQAPA